MPINDVIAELKAAASKKGYELSDGSAHRLISQVDLKRLEGVPVKQRDELYAFLFERIDQPYSNQRNIRGQIILHEPDADALIASVRSSRSLGKLRDLWCLIFIGGCL
jgi:hypothetical protein